MKRISLSLLWCFVVATVAFAGKEITLKDIARGYYTAQSIYGVNPLLDGEHYAQISADYKRIVKYSFKTGEEVGTIFDATTAKGEQVTKVDGYIMSPDESVILIQTKTQRRYRRSFTAEFYIYNVKNNTLVPLSTNGAQEVPKFSPDGNNIAFVRENNLFLVKLLFNNSESQVTEDGRFNEVLNGIPDWVNEEEFGYSCAYDFSADSKMLAWIRFDEREVPEYSFPMFKGAAPEYPEYDLYPGEYTYKYPVAGAKNADVTVHTFDIKSKVTRKMDLPLDADGYVPRIKFTSDPDQLAILTLNRHQNRLEMYMANPRSTVCNLVMRDEAPQYIKESAYGSLTFYDNNFVIMSERDGFNHLYLYNLRGQLVKQITKGEFEVTKYIGWDQKNNLFYYETNEHGPEKNSVYKMDAKGRVTELTKELGTNKSIFSTTFRYFMNTYSTINTPYVYTLRDNTGKVLATMLDNARLVGRLAELDPVKKEFFTFTTSEGVTLNGWMVRPADFDAQKKYPVIMFQYSGPGSQEVKDCWSAGGRHNGCIYEAYLAQEGYISVCIDGRGTGGRGAEFEKCTYQNLGIKESNDQVEGALWLGTLPYVDKERIGIWGWSFGGYNTLMSLSDGRAVFKAGCAVAPPTSWRYYDTVYTERFMRTPQENNRGYDLTSAMNRIDKLHGKLLIVHGMADDNVHFRNVAEYTEALVQAGYPFQMQVYTNRNHSIRGGNTTLHLYNLMVDFFNTNLK